jgi:hypothetical protein
MVWVIGHFRKFRKVGREGRARGQICLPKPSATALLSGRRQQVGAPTVPSAFIARSVECGHWCNSCEIMSFMWNHVIHVKSSHSCEIMSFMWNHVIYEKSCNLWEIMSFMWKSCHSCKFLKNHVKSCQIMSIHVNSCNSCHLSLDFSGNSVKCWGGWGGVKYVFPGLRRQLRCQAEGKNSTWIYKL